MNKKIQKQHINLKVENIIPYENNNKIHTEKSTAEVIKSIKKNSYIAPIIVDEKNTILAWHGRYFAIQKIWTYSEIDVLRITGLTNTQKKDYRIRDNTTNLMSEWDLEALHQEILALWEDSYDLIDQIEWLDTLNFFDDETYNEEIEDEVPNIENQEIVVKQWDIFKLWDHILVCGDSSKKEDVQKLMQWKQADMIFTDPPYNVNYKWGWKITGTDRKIENDHMSDTNFITMLNEWFKRYQEITKKEAWVYVFHSTSTKIQFQQALELNGFEIKNQLIWNKPSAALWWGDYRWKHEPFFYCSQKEWKTNFYGDRAHGTVIETFKNKSDEDILRMIKRVKKAESEWKMTLWSMRRCNVNEYVHPTQKPIELIEYALKNSSKKWNIVVDLFWWSGSTLIASEKTNRTCHMMELDPIFIQTIIQRYFDVTNWSKEIECLNRNLNLSFLLE